MKNNTARTSLPPGVPWTLPNYSSAERPGRSLSCCRRPHLELTVLPFAGPHNSCPALMSSDIYHNIRGTPLLFSITRLRS